MDNNKFTAKHSSVLRIMTKWAEYLEELFKNAEKVYTHRTYPFKTIDQHLLFNVPQHSGTFEVGVF